MTFIIKMMTVTLCFVMMFQLITCSPDTCPMIRYIGSFDFNNHVKDHALFGSSYKNLTSNTVQQCFSMCIQDCRCVSYQMYDKQCQLIDENRQTVSDAHFMPISGYLYFELNQDFKNKESACSSQCHNGCCRSSPCQNGGTCIELCDNVTRKFKCKCLPGYSGRVCKRAVSCNAYSTRSSADVYPIYTSKSTPINVYCDMVSEPGMVWTLLESFALSNNDKYWEIPFTKDFPINEDNLNWSDYRVSLFVMQHIKSHATQWRATCRFDQDGFSKTDYVRGLLSDIDIMKGATGCFRVEYINIKGIEHRNGTTHVKQDARHIFLDSTVGRIILGCDIHFPWDDFSDNFGFYKVLNKGHRCSASASSTTQ